MPSVYVCVSAVTAKVFLHHTELLLFLTLLKIQNLHLSLETTLLLSEALVFQLLLFQL